MRLEKDEDFLYGDDVYAYTRSESKKRTYDDMHFFTDRAIYRPGQTVYFKGILIARNSDDRAPWLLKKKPLGWCSTIRTTRKKAS